MRVVVAAVPVVTAEMRILKTAQMEVLVAAVVVLIMVLLLAVLLHHPAKEVPAVLELPEEARLVAVAAAEKEERVKLLLQVKEEMEELDQQLIV